MKQENRETLEIMLERIKEPLDYSGVSPEMVLLNLIPTMIRFDCEYMVENYPELIIQYTGE